tara:strand:- start:3734 stop:4099 length:366 start_codon:yes stop_codon:yes gene_type:complete
MKTFIFIALFAISGLAQAQSLRELRCESFIDQVEVNLDFGFNRGLRSASAEIYQDRNLVERTYMTLRGTFGQYEYRYFGAFGTEFVLNTWPDLKPQWGRSYRGEYRSRDLSSRNMRCQFWY